MSASLVHFAVCDDVLRASGLADGMEKRLLEAWRRFPNFARLGSVGPDLPYYETPVKDGLKMKLDINIPIQPHGYLLHTKEPNVFATKLFHIIEADGPNEASDGLLAFAAGYLTHLATDYVIHPYVNDQAGKYYVSEEHQRTHRLIEIYQDVYLFRKMYEKTAQGEDQDVGDAFRKKDLEAKIDVPGESALLGGWDTQRSLRMLFQRAFLETHGIHITEQNVEDWFDGMSKTLRVLNKNVSPYTRALHKPEDQWANKAYPPGVFFGDQDPIVALTTQMWKDETAKPSPLTGNASSASALQVENNKSLYGRAIARGVKYLQAASAYLMNHDYRAFVDAIPGNDLSDPLGGEPAVAGH